MGAVPEALKLEFMRRLRITKNFAQLTRPNDCPMWINGSAVSSIRVPLPNEYAASVNTVIFTGDFTQGVKEMPSDVKAEINEHGGEL